MKKIKTYLSFIAIFTLLFTSCSKDENSNPGDSDKATLSFGAIVADLTAKSTEKQSAIEDMPVCSDDTPAYVEIVLMQGENEIVGTAAEPYRVDLVAGQVPAVPPAQVEHVGIGEALGIAVGGVVRRDHCRPGLDGVAAHLDVLQRRPHERLGDAEIPQQLLHGPVDERGLGTHIKTGAIMADPAARAAVGIPDDPEFRSALVAYLEWGSRLAVLNSQPGAEAVSDAPMPKWSWGVPGGPYQE